ncbi:lysosomal cystine transporter [Artemisia annua]|uniref:Lysosomal cystine transporter n=1 Tax=Artemisia annua TaxID=35608 RepID=A0A2U1KCM2_ARTAN|nr:lysosomal cystine transporter [Artemisia annua]
MSSWNSVELKVLSTVLGCVVGLNFDFVVLNLTKHTSYLIYNASMFFSSVVQRQYHEKYGFDQMIPVAANDLAFSSHAVLLTAFTLFQITIYDVAKPFLKCLFKVMVIIFMQRGSQNVSRVTIVIVAAAWIAIAISVIIAIWTNNWLWLISCFNMLQVFMTVIKYIPQAYMNFRRKSTSGFSIGNILLDLLGAIANYGQMTVQSIDQHSWVNFYGNVGKALLSLISIFFDLLFIVQHSVLYRVKTPRSHSLYQEALVIMQA